MAPKTINDSSLACIKRLLNYEVQNNRLSENVADEVRVSTRGLAGVEPLPYENEEVVQILMLARQQRSDALRWLPWLCAFSGSRIGEVTQLWGARIKQVDGVWVMSIKPAEDGGRLKNAWSERDTPLHQAVIDEGFLEFVRERGPGPLFYGRSSGDPNRKHASKGVSNRVADWIRSQGFRDPRKAPSHVLAFLRQLETMQVEKMLEGGCRVTACHLGHGVFPCNAASTTRRNQDDREIRSALAHSSTASAIERGNTTPTVVVGSFRSRSRSISCIRGLQVGSTPPAGSGAGLFRCGVEGESANDLYSVKILSQMSIAAMTWLCLIGKSSQFQAGLGRPASPCNPLITRMVL